MKPRFSGSSANPPWVSPQIAEPGILRMDVYCSKVRLLNGSGSVDFVALNGDLARSRAAFSTFSGAKGAAGPRGSAEARAASNAPLTAASAPAIASFRNSLRGVSAMTLVYRASHHRQERRRRRRAAVGTDLISIA